MALISAEHEERVATALVMAVLVEDDEDPWAAARVRLERAVQSLTEIRDGMKPRRGRPPRKLGVLDTAIEIARQAQQDCDQVAQHIRRSES